MKLSKLLVHRPDKNALQRARRAYARNLAESGDCKNLPHVLKGLAIAAEADTEIHAGWLSQVQSIGCKIADLLK